MDRGRLSGGLFRAAVPIVRYLVRGCAGGGRGRLRSPAFITIRFRMPERPRRCLPWSHARGCECRPGRVRVARLQGGVRSVQALVRHDRSWRPCPRGPQRHRARPARRFGGIPAYHAPTLAVYFAQALVPTLFTYPGSSRSRSCRHCGISRSRRRALRRSAARAPGARRGGDEAPSFVRNCIATSTICLIGPRIANRCRTSLTR